MNQKGNTFLARDITKITKIRALGSKCVPSLQERSPGTQNIQKTTKMNQNPRLPTNNPKSSPVVVRKIRLKKNPGYDLEGPVVKERNYSDAKDEDSILGKEN